MTPKLTFHGAAGCVTGFCARLETEHANVLIDCGMFQGPKTLKALNYEPFPFAAREIDAVLLTHAHIDHSGLLPKLMRAGFRGPIVATAATRDLCAVMLADAGDIQEREVEHLNRRNAQRGRGVVEPIYTAKDAAACMGQFHRVKLGVPVQVAPGLTATYWEAGHILGSASIELQIDTEDGPLRLLFSGDLGPGGRDYFADPEAPSGVDHVIMESTYGDRDRPPIDPAGRRQALAAALLEAHAAGGPLLIPAFAVARSQELLADILTLMDEGAVPPADIFLDSPLAIEASEVFLQRGWNSAAQRNPFEGLQSAERLRFLRRPAESDQLDRLRGWHIIVAASGMCDAGRVRKHLKRLLWRREATILITGFQATGTLGRLLAEGAPRVRIQGEDVRVRARIRSLDIYSAHADAGGLVAWAKARQPVGGSVFLVHGEPDSTAGLRSRLVAAGFDQAALLTPSIDQSFKLSRTAVDGAAPAPTRIAPEAVAALDWHNQRAALLIALDEQLEAQQDDGARAALLGRLASVLQDQPATQATSCTVTP